MHAFLGCLFILIFGAFFFIIGIIRLFYHSIFGGAKRTNPWGQRTSGTTYNQNSSTGQNKSQSQTHTDYTAGNAHHEFGNESASPGRTGKIFNKNEGEYVDFEEI